MGPPESPWQESAPPSRWPAQNMPATMAFLPYTSGALHASVGRMGSQAERSSREYPAPDVPTEPQPEMEQLVPGCKCKRKWK